MREQFHIWQSAITKNQIDKIFNEVDKNHLIGLGITSRKTKDTQYEYYNSLSILFLE